MHKNTVKTILATAALLAAAHASAQITFYEREGFRGPAFRTDKPIRNFERAGLNHHPASMVVERGRWQVCDDRRFEGRCVILRPGSYASLGQLGLDGQIIVGEAGAQPGRRTTTTSRSPWPRRPMNIASVPRSACSRFPSRRHARSSARRSSAAGSSASRCRSGPS